jgi:hypothetical protein
MPALSKCSERRGLTRQEAGVMKYKRSGGVAENAGEALRLAWWRRHVEAVNEAYGEIITSAS